MLVILIIAVLINGMLLVVVVVIIVGRAAVLAWLSVAVMLMLVALWGVMVVVTAMSLKSVGLYSSGLKAPALVVISVGMVGNGGSGNVFVGGLFALCDEGVGWLGRWRDGGVGMCFKIW